MKKISIIVVSLLMFGAIGWKLSANKEEMKEKAKLAEITSTSIPVEVTSIEFTTLDGRITADGTFVASNDLNLISETQGKVVKVYKKKGAKVAKGDLLAEVENDVLQAEVEAVKANYEKLQADNERFTILSKTNAVTERQLEDVKIGLKNAKTQYLSSKKRLENTYIKAPISGEINDDFIQEGAFISGGMKLYELVNVDKLKLNVKLTANEIMNVSLGDKIEIISEIYPDGKFLGKVTAIAAKADAALKYNIEIELKNNNKNVLKPGMYATANFNFKGATKKSYLMRDAIIGSIQKPQVFVVNDNQAELKNLTIGQVENNKVEVVEGLNETDRVVLTGHINLTEGTKVTVLNAH